MKSALRIASIVTVVTAVAVGVQLPRVVGVTASTGLGSVTLPADAGSDIGSDFGSDAGVVAVDATLDAVGVDALGSDAGIVIADAGSGSGSASCPIEDLADEDAGDGEFEYDGDEFTCDSVVSIISAPRRVALLANLAPPRLDNKVKDKEKIDEAEKNDKAHSTLLEANRERIAEVLEAPTKMPEKGDKNPLGITFERFKEAVDGDAKGERTALQFIDTPAGGGQPARTAKDNQAQFAAELKDAMAKINERLQKEGTETLGEYQFVIIGSGTTFFSNNPLKEIATEPKVFGQKTVGTPPDITNQQGTRKDVDMDIQLTCPTMVGYMSQHPHELNQKITRFLGPDNAIYNLFRSSGATGVTEKYFPELQAVTTRWQTTLGLKEVDIKLVTELEIKEVGAAPGPILLLGGP